MKKNLKKLTAVLLAAIMFMAGAVPASAASKTVKIKPNKKTYVTINAGQCYHLVNSNIKKNKVSSYTYRIMPRTKSTRYDISFSYNGVGLATADCREDSDYVKSSTYLKTSNSSNSGLIACIYVKSGSVKMSVSYKSTNKKGNLAMVRQSSSHRPLKAVTVRKNHKISLQRKAGNVSYTPVILSGKKGTLIKRTINSNTYETYNFGAKNIAFKSITNKMVKKAANMAYDTANGSYRYTLLLMPGTYSGVMSPVKGTSATFLYPTDTMSIRASVK